MKHEPVSTSSAKDDSKTSITEIVYAGLFLAITIAAFTVAAFNWGWK
jgi:hypothetical protein